METTDMEKKTESETGQLDKFKRRLIRSVAWMLINQKMPESEVWNEMKKVMRCDCQQLWEHMRSLTQKKLRRLLVAEDKVMCIPDIARMSLTDWQLYDQVLVHEDLDVVGLHTMDPYKPDNKVLIDLFGLVQRFDIEGKKGDALADAWSAATVHYNLQGHQCSPMLLQKRWYQLKYETRRRFYEYWHSYRGNEKMMPKAEQYRPTVLQRTLARRFPEVITKEFPDWDTSIEEGSLILPDDFISRKNVKVLPKPNIENSPDIIVMEPNIETVDLIQDSDSEEESTQEDSADINNEKDDNDPVTELKVKEEPEESEIDYRENEEPKKTDLAMADVVAEETRFDNMNDDEIVELTEEENNINTITSSLEDEIINDDNATQENPGTDEVFIPKITNVFGNINMTDETLSIIDNLTRSTPWPAKVSESNEVTNNEDSNKEKDASDGPVCLGVDIEDLGVSDGEVELINENASKKTSNTDTSPLRPDSNADAVLSKIPDANVSVRETNITDSKDFRKLQFGNIDLSSFGEISEDLNFADDGIEFADDGVTDTALSIDKIKKEDVHKDVEHSQLDENKHSTKNASDILEFKLDEKLFLDPVVYTQKLDDMCILKNQDINTVNVKTLLNKIIIESKPISDRSVDAEKARIDRQRISPSSYMLQKPKNRKYNPIQLCKNPDFNTRLKRLTAGFLSSWQNRTQLKACKPLTIDLTKAFESKLINNTIYLKKPDKNRIIEIDKDEIKTTSVMPSVIPVQTLIDNTRLDDVLKLKSGYSSDSSSSQYGDTVVERNKVIHLPDITQVRRINQSLLTAEVSPIQMQNMSNNSNSNNVNIKPGSDVTTNKDILTAQTSNSEGANKSVANNTSTGAPKANLLAKMLAAPSPSPVFRNPIQNTLHNRLQSITTDLNKQKKLKTPTPGPIKGVKLWRPSRPSWLQGFTYPEVKHDEFLLTTDTLHKMLHLFNGDISNQPVVKTKPKPKKKVEKKKETKPRPKRRESNAKALNEQSKGGDTSKKGPRRVVTNVVYGNSSCCWAREQIASHTKETHKRRKSHACLNTGSCRCCCKDDLEKMVAVDKIRPELVVPTISGVFSLNSAVQEEISLNPTATFSSQTLINDVVEQSLTSQKPDDESIELDIPIYDDTHIIKPNIIPKIIVSSTKNNHFELNVPGHGVNQVTKSLLSAEATIPNSGVEHLKPNIPIYDETQLNKPILKHQTNAVSIENNPTSAVKNLSTPIRDETKLVKPVNPDVFKDDNAVDDTIKISKKPKPLLETLDGPIKLGDVDTKPKQCTCPSKTLNQKYKKSIVIDDTGIKGKIHDNIRVTAGPSYKDKVLILNSKQMTKIPVGCPIFLGTNKILLTNIKFPSSIEKSSQNRTVLKCSQYSAPPLPLPRGVQLVLPHTGQLTYIMKSGFELSPEDKAKMPALLATIQMQMNSAGTASTTETTTGNISNEVVDISDDEISSTPEIVNDVISTSAAICDEQNNENDSSLNSSLEQIEISQTTTKVEEILSNEVSDDELTSQTQQTVIQLPDHNEKCSEDDSEPQNEESMENPSIVSSATDPTLDERTVIAVDLSSEVEKSSDDDKLNEKKKIAPNSKKTILSDLMEMSGISAEDMVSAQVSPAINEGITAPSYLSNPSTSLPLPDNEIQLTHELNTVSSFTQLKYACQNNGKFYKLDFETGIIVPINVCLKKKPQISAASDIPVAPKETIDLTEDIEFTAENEDTAKAVDVTPIPTPNPLVKLLKSKMHNVRPVTMFRTMQRPRILRKIDNEHLPPNLQIIKTPLGRSREVRLAYKPPVKQNIEDAVQPVKQKRKSASPSNMNLSLSESSDDEPLIKKVKRKQAQEAESTSNLVFDLHKEFEKHPNIVRNLTKGPEDDPTALAEDDIRLFEDPPNETFFMEDNVVMSDDDGEEDCILGV